MLVLKFIHKLLMTISKQRLKLFTSVSSISHPHDSYSEDLITCGFDSLTILMKKKIRHGYMSKLRRQRWSARKA